MEKIVLLMGLSGSGVNLILKSILSRDSFKEYNFNEVIKHTTRPKMDDELGGINYKYNTVLEMNTLEEEKKILEKNVYLENENLSYFTCISDIELNRNNIVIISLKNYKKYLETFGKERLIPIFIEQNKGDILKSLITNEMVSKSPNYINACQTFLDESTEYSKANLEENSIENVIVNSNLDTSLNEIQKILISKIN